MNQLVDRLKEK